jgi:hypothetical protein
MLVQICRRGLIGEATGEATSCDNTGEATLRDTTQNHADLPILLLNAMQCQQQALRPKIKYCLFPQYLPTLVKRTLLAKFQNYFSSLPSLNVHLNLYSVKEDHFMSGK